MSRWFIPLYAAVLLGAPIAVDRAPGSAGTLWLVILWASWIAALVWSLTRPPFSLLFAANLAAMFLFVIFPATTAQLFGHTTIGGNDYRDGVARALEIAALAQGAMLAGAVTARTLRPVPRFRRLPPRLSPSRLDQAARLSVAAGILGVVAFSALGGASLRDFFAFTAPGGYGTFAGEATGNLAFLVPVQCAAGLAVVLLPLRLGRSGSARWLGPLLVAVLAIVVLVGGGQRVRLFVPAFAAALVWLKTSKKDRPLRRVAAAGLIVMVVLGGLIGVARTAAGDRHVTAGTVLADPFSTDANLFLPLAGLASTVPDRLGYLDGRSYLETAVFLVPRALWGGKPQGSIAAVTRVVDPGNSGLAFPEFGEMYANFGLPGVVAGSLLLGAIIELLWLRIARTDSIRECVFAAVCGAILLDLFTRGAIAPVLTTFAGLLAATALACRRRSAVLAGAPQQARSGPTRPEKSRPPVAAP